MGATESDTPWEVGLRNSFASRGYFKCWLHPESCYSGKNIGYKIEIPTKKNIFQKHNLIQAAFPIS